MSNFDFDKLEALLCDAWASASGDVHWQEVAWAAINYLAECEERLPEAHSYGVPASRDVNIIRAQFGARLAQLEEKLIVQRLECDEDVVAMRAERDRIREAAQKLVEALPRCTFMVPGEDADTQCFKTAFWDFEEFEGTGNGSFCDEHVHSVADKEWTFGYGYAEPLRALLAALKATHDRPQK